MTLIEISVVLLVLVALAGLTVPYISTTSGKVMCEATDISMQNLKKVIMDNYFIDTNGKYPQNTGNYNLTCLFESCGVSEYDPTTNIGFRKGGYLQNGVKLNDEQINNLDSSFKDSADTDLHIHEDATTADLFILDAWRNPIVIQQVTPDDFRLVSAGVNGKIETSITNKDTTDSTNLIDITLANPRKNDDRILYLNIPTPSHELNTPCDQY